MKFRRPTVIFTLPPCGSQNPQIWREKSEIFTQYKIKYTHSNATVAVAEILFETAKKARKCKRFNIENLSFENILSIISHLKFTQSNRLTCTVDYLFLKINA